MRVGRRRWVAVTAVLGVLCVLVAVLVATAAGPAAQPSLSDSAAVPTSAVVTVADGQLGPLTTQSLPFGGVPGTADGLPLAGSGDVQRAWSLVEGEDGRDYSVPPTFEYSPPDSTLPDSTPMAETSAGGTDTPWAAPADPSAAVAQAVSEAETVGVHQAVVVVDRGSGAVLAQQAADEPFPALSLVKLMIAADVLAGSGSDAVADDVTRAWMREMIVTSDDVTAADFYEPAGADELIDRVVQRFGLTGTSPTPDGEYWGNVQTTATDMAVLLGDLLADPASADVVGPAMLASTAIAADGVDQRFGLRAVPGAGSKQGWGCCLSGVVGIHSVGFTPDRIVVVLSDAETDDESLGEQDGLALQADPGAQVSMAAVTDTVRAALGG